MSTLEYQAHAAVTSARLESDILAGLAVALDACGMPDVIVAEHLDALALIRQWAGRPMWEMNARDTDTYFTHHTRDWNYPTRLAHAQALACYFTFLAGLAGQEILAVAGLEPARCPLDELNWPAPFLSGRSPLAAVPGQPAAED